MPRKTLDHELLTISTDLLILGSMVERSLVTSVTALRDHDMEKSRFVREGDQRINAQRYQMESSILEVVATQAPLTRDLRFLSSALVICTELERIGDYAKAVANANLRSGGISIQSLLVTAHKMGVKTAVMLHRAMTAFIEMDEKTARALIYEDDVIDGLYQQMYNASIERVLEDPRITDRVNFILWVAHSLERSADRVTNICERTIYVKTGYLEANATDPME